MGKRAQAWSVEAYIAIGIFLMAIIFFYVFVSARTASVSIEDETEDLSRTIMEKAYFNDSELTSAELEELVVMDCDTIQDLLETDSDLCIYFKDSNGEIILLAEELGEEYYSMGCEGFNISDGVECGQGIIP